MFLHSIGVVHSNLRMCNVLLSNNEGGGGGVPERPQDARIKIADSGISQLEMELAFGDKVLGNKVLNSPASPKT